MYAVGLTLSLFRVGSELADSSALCKKVFVRKLPFAHARNSVYPPDRHRHLAGLAVADAGSVHVERLGDFGCHAVVLV